MEVPIIIAVFVVVIGVNALFWWGNHRRIRREIDSIGGRVVTISWSPLGRGWVWTPRHAILYKVSYYDRWDRLHEGCCRTDCLLGNRWTENRVVGDPQAEALEPGQTWAWLR